MSDVCAALLAVPGSEEQRYSMDQHHITELIEWLQNRSDVDQSVLGRIEWIFLPLLDHLFGNAPRALERQLATSPDFFHEVISTVFKSKFAKDDEPIAEERKQLASQAFTLLHQWRTPPGTLPDGTIDQRALKKWIEKAKALCEASGHLQIGLDQIGKVFAHAPVDPGGFWIDKAVAEQLNHKDAVEMREAFNVEQFNMRGTHGYTAGKDERAISQSWQQKAQALDNEGYTRFAASLRKLAQSYEQDAKREETENPYGD